MKHNGMRHTKYVANLMQLVKRKKKRLKLKDQRLEMFNNYSIYNKLGIDLDHLQYIYNYKIL